MPARFLDGVVVSAKNNCTVTVRVERMDKHPQYGKYVRTHKKYAAHDPRNFYKDGDAVKIMESRPYSKTKTWIVCYNDEKRSSGGML